MQVPNLWEARDRKVLVAATELLNGSDWGVTADQVAAHCGLSRREVCQSVETMNGTYLAAQDCSTYDGRNYLVSSIKPGGLRLVGAWPSGDTATELIIAQLERIASSLEHPEEERSAAQTVLDVLKEVGTSVIAEAISKALTG